MNYGRIGRLLTGEDMIKFWKVQVRVWVRVRVSSNDTVAVAQNEN